MEYDILIKNTCKSLIIAWLHYKYYSCHYLKYRSNRKFLHFSSKITVRNGNIRQHVINVADACAIHPLEERPTGFLSGFLGICGPTLLVWCFFNGTLLVVNGLVGCVSFSFARGICIVTANVEEGQYSVNWRLMAGLFWM